MDLAGRSSISENVTSICTTGCGTCVGVYIPVDSERFFAAHIDGAILNPNDDRHRSLVVDWQIPDDLSSSLKETVQAALDRTFHRQDVENIQQSPDLKDRAVIVCTWPIVGGIPGPGFHIINLLCDYFHLDKAKVVDPYTANHGFIIDHFQRILPIILNWTRPGPTPWVMDEIAKIADKCDKPVWAHNFRSVFRATFEYVMPDDLGWEDMRPASGPVPWCIEYVARRGAWQCGG